jgi:hypothetical protein
MSLFGRRAIVQIDTGARGLRVEGLDVSFAIDLDTKNFGKAEIKIFNLNRDHRQQLEQSKTVDVELLVGYQDQSLDRLCMGTLRDVFSERDPPDWITTLRSGDGDKATKARINRSYPPGTPISKVWQDLVDGLGEQGILSGNAVEAFSKGEYTNGIKELLHGGVAFGPMLENLRKLASGKGLDVTIQEGELIVTPIGEALATSAIVLSPNTGLIGSPQPGPKKKLKCRALILPGLKPKRKVEIKSELVQGLYVIEKAKYTGDTAGNDWYADLVCKEL